MEASPDLNIDQLNKLARYRHLSKRSYHRTLAALQKILAERRKQQKQNGLLAGHTYDQAFEDAVESLIALRLAGTPSSFRKSRTDKILKLSRKRQRPSPIRTATKGWSVGAASCFSD